MRLVVSASASASLGAALCLGAPGAAPTQSRSEEEAGHLVARGFKVMCEDQLELWCADERRYPEFTLATFKRWFDVEFRACVEDLGAEPLEDDRDEDRAISDHDGL